MGENPNGLGLIPLTVWRGGNLTGSIKNCRKPVPNFLIIFLGRYPQRKGEIWPTIWAEKALITNIYYPAIWRFVPLQPWNWLPAWKPCTPRASRHLSLLGKTFFWCHRLCLNCWPVLCVLFLPKQTAPGPTDALLTQLAAMVSLVSQGMAPTTIVGQLLYHLVVASVQGEARHYFWPWQVGIGVNGGEKKVVYTNRAWIQRNSSSSQKVLVKINFVNVFTCVSHEVAFSKITAKFLDLTRFTWYCQISTMFAVSFFLSWNFPLGCSKATLSAPCFLLQPSIPLANTLWAECLALLGWRVKRFCGGASSRPEARLPLVRNRFGGQGIPSVRGYPPMSWYPFAM